MNNSVIKPCSIKPAPGFRRTTPEEQDVQFREALHRNIMRRIAEDQAKSEQVQS